MKKFVTFKEALAALEEGKEVSFYNNQTQVTFDKHINLDQLELNECAFTDLFQGTWIIEN